MKRLAICVLFWLIGVFGAGPQHTYAQSDAASKPSLNQERILKDLVNEVRQLRLEVRRMSTNAYRVQSMMERLRLQQEIVNRLTTELSKVRNQLADLKSERVGLKARVVEIEKKYEAGTIPESEVSAVRAAIEQLNQREPDLTERESQLAAELNVERGNLLELNGRLDQIERELLITSKVEEDKPRKKDP